MLLKMAGPMIKGMDEATLKGFAVNLVNGFKNFIQKKTEEKNSPHDFGFLSLIKEGVLVIIPIEVTAEGKTIPHSEDAVVVDAFLHKIDYKKAVGRIIDTMDDKNGPTIVEIVTESLKS